MGSGVRRADRDCLAEAGGGPGEITPASSALPVLKWASG